MNKKKILKELRQIFSLIKGDISTRKVNKITLSSNGDKRMQAPDFIKNICIWNIKNIGKNK